ncbi:MAG: TonB-dependent receptor plug domain-containing protein, partial [Bacteroidota bacterium]
MKKIVSVVILAILFINFSVLAQTINISGLVTSAEDGSALPGVSVILKGTKTAAISDINGRYTLLVPAEGAVLQFFSVGTQPAEVVVGSTSVIDVSLVAANADSEAKLKTFYRPQPGLTTGSVTSVNGESFEYFPVQSFDQALQGRVAGVQVQAASGAPGGGVNVRIRGKGSFGDNSPLYIVDGIQVNSGSYTSQGSSNVLASINPNDIESIEILRDAAATAMYGAQSANGVIVITTKRGAPGKTNVEVTYQKGNVS